MSKLMQKEGCKNFKCEAWRDKCQRAVVFRIGGKKFISERHNTKQCELFLQRKFKDERVRLPE